MADIPGIITLAEGALAGMVLGILMVTLGDRLVQMGPRRLARAGQGLVTVGLVAILGSGVWLWPRTFVPTSAAGGPDCSPSSPARPTTAADNESASAFSARSRPPDRPEPGVLSGEGAPTAEGDRRRTLVLYDGVKHDWSARVSAQQAADLASHFGSWTVKPVSEYKAREAGRYSAVLYMGSSSAPRLPASFLGDVLSTRVPVLWVNENLQQLARHDPSTWKSRYAFHTSGPNVHGISRIVYQGATLTRQTQHHDPGIRHVRIDDPRTVRTVAEGRRPDGSRFPWAVRASNLWYVADSPLDYVTPTDRYLAFSDLLFDVLAPGTPHRHRALVRLEDISPASDPAQLRAVATCLHQARVPFSFGVIPVYTDPRGAAHGGRPTTFGLRDRPELVEALRYMIDHGGAMVMHGVTHQLDGKVNPYNAITGADYEFVTAHQDRDKNVVIDGLVPGHSRERTLKRLDQGLAEFEAAGLPRPQIFEFPHYAAGPDDYEAVGQRFGYRYDETMTYASSFSGSAPDPDKGASQSFPYGVRDSYGTAVIPETLGNVETAGHNGRPPRGPADIIDAARRTLAVRDGVASFFYHPSLGTDTLEKLVQGIRGLGYRFVTPQEVMAPETSSEGR